jgi:hypothetical protein
MAENQVYFFIEIIIAKGCAFDCDAKEITYRVSSRSKYMTNLGAEPEIREAGIFKD